MQAAWTMVVCATALTGCSAGGIAPDDVHRLDPTKIYLGAFDHVETTRREMDQYRCLSGAPLTCRIIAIRAECECTY